MLDNFFIYLFDILSIGMLGIRGLDLFVFVLLVGMGSCFGVGTQSSDGGPSPDHVSRTMSIFLSSNYLEWREKKRGSVSEMQNFSSVVEAC